MSGRVRWRQRCARMCRTEGPAMSLAATPVSTKMPAPTMDPMPTWSHGRPCACWVGGGGHGQHARLTDLRDARSRTECKQVKEAHDALELLLVLVCGCTRCARVREGRRHGRARWSGSARAVAVDGACGGVRSAITCSSGFLRKRMVLRRRPHARALCMVLAAQWLPPPSLLASCGCGSRLPAPLASDDACVAWARPRSSCGRARV